MPELPEVQTTVSGLKKKVLSRAFIDVWTDTEKLVKKPDFKNFKKEIKNKKIKNVFRRGKNIIFELSGGYFLLAHLKMTGHFLYGSWERKGEKWASLVKGPLEDKYNGYIHLIFFLDNKKMLAFSDLRKFGKIMLLSKEELERELGVLGPEPLSKEFIFKKFKNILKNKKGRIKQVLMNQEVIVGIGNIYSDEILWQAKINPEKDASKLLLKELKKIYLAARYILKNGVELKGTSVSDYRDINGEKGLFGRVIKVYGKEGQKCPRCKDIIKRKKIGGRSAHFCPSCQKL